MSKQQFESGLNQSLQAIAFPLEQSSSPSAPISSEQKKMLIEYKELKYDETKPIGRGTYGVVFAGQYRQEIVAIKIYDFRGQLSQMEQVGILREAALMVSLNSPFLVSFRGICWDPRYCMVMEYCEGGALRARLNKTDQEIDPKDQLRWAQQISYGVDALHKIKIIHRDLKGENIFLDSQNNCKLGDFGLSIIKHSSASQSKSGGLQVAGTLPWMAPELFQNKPNSRETDIYSLGIILWEIISRKIPYADATPFAIAGMAMVGTRPTIDSTWPLIFKTLIAACWDGDPTKRPTAKKVGDEFVAALQSVTSVPKPIDPLFDDDDLFAPPMPISKPKVLINQSSSLSATVGKTTEQLKIEQLETKLRQLELKHTQLQQQQDSLDSSLDIARHSQSSIPKLKSVLTSDADAKSLRKLLRLVVESERDRAEELIEKNKQLLLLSGSVIDLSGRAFKNITAFQYALWAMDYYMWEMIRNYLPRDAQEEQLISLECEGMEHGKHYDIKPLIDALQTYVDNLKEWNYDERSQEHWRKNVGGAQKMVPVHIVHIYNDYSFDPCPTTWYYRNLHGYQVSIYYDYSRSQWIKGSWFTTPTAPEAHGAELGSTFAFYKGKEVHVDPNQYGPYENARLDLIALQSMWKARTQQLEQLKNDFTAPSKTIGKVQRQNVPLLDDDLFDLAPVKKTKSSEQKLTAEKLEMQAVAEVEKDKELIEVKKNIDMVDAKELTKLLRLVAEGEQDQAEAMIKKKQELLFFSGKITDLSRRTFKNITAFQYALWALDWHMWRMIQKYLPKEAQIEQLSLLENKGTKHEKHYDMEPLTSALLIYIDNEKKWDTAQKLDYWRKKVGGAQKGLPMHVVNEYCRTDRFDRYCWPLERKSKLPRTREIRVGTGGGVYELKDWFTLHIDSFALYRGEGGFAEHTKWYSLDSEVQSIDEAVPIDFEALQSLWETRLGQLTKLKSELMPMPQPAGSPPVDAKSLGKLLQWVAEGEQDQAEALIKQNPELLLIPGSVTDLSDRSFYNITAFQYALWAIDWHMWTMIRKYLPKAAQVEQFTALESKGTEYGKHYDIQYLTKALQKYLNNAQDKAQKWNYKEMMNDQWRKRVGRTQRMLPAHLINEYCRPDRSFDPCPTQWKTKLPRTYKIEGWNGSETVKFSWFTGPLHQRFLGFDFAFYNNPAWERAKYIPTVAVVHSYKFPEVSRVNCDLHALISLWKTRTEQLEKLKFAIAAGLPAKLENDLFNVPSLLLQLVSEGEQDLAEELVKENPELLLTSGSVTDLSGRTFNNITVFQYALWALDYHMWTMIQKYLPKEAQTEQFKILESKGTEHGKYYDMKPLMNMLQTYVDYKKTEEKKGFDFYPLLRDLDQSDDDAPKFDYKLWHKNVGKTQRTLPAHVVNEYANPRPFDPCPKEWESKLLRTREVVLIDDRENGSWFIDPSPSDSVGEPFVFVKGQRTVATGQKFHQAYPVSDLVALGSLWKMRTQQLTRQKIVLGVGATQEELLELLLQLVADGEQDQAELLIKENPKILLTSGSVTDLAGCTFNNITAFQYALWALDYHMWTMIKKYLPKEAQVQQFNTLESKGTEHGKHYDIKPLTDALQAYVALLERWEIDVAYEKQRRLKTGNYDWHALFFYWKERFGAEAQKIIFKTQKLMPIHVVNEYCRTDRSFKPCPIEWESKLPRIREVKTYNSNHNRWMNVSWSFILVQSDSIDYLYREGRDTVYANSNVFDSPYTQLQCDLQALQSLWKTRTDQLNLLKTELSKVITSKLISDLCGSDAADDVFLFPEDDKEQRQENARIIVESKKEEEKEKRIADPIKQQTSISSTQNSTVLMPAPKRMTKLEPMIEVKSLGKLLQLIVAGEQDQAEAMIQQNKQLLLYAGEVTDLSGRTFKNISAFQYAFWTMDYHMWTMIRKYLPQEAQVKQWQQWQAQVPEKERHYDIKPLTDVLQTYIENWSNWSYEQCKDHWCQIVGAEQKLVPVHVVNEYCRTDRSLDPCPAEWESKLPRTQQVQHWNGPRITKGSWFIAPSEKNCLGSNFAFYRGSNQSEFCSGARIGHGRYLWAQSDLKALQSLWNKRTQQLKELAAELTSALIESRRIEL